jgi:hypothetical protein
VTVAISITNAQPNTVVNLGLDNADHWNDYLRIMSRIKVGDGPSKTYSRLAPGTYRLNVNSPANKLPVNYQLRLDPFQLSYKMAEPLDIAEGVHVTSLLAPNDSFIVDADEEASNSGKTGRPYKLFRLSGKSGDHFSVWMRSKTLDTYLETLTRSDVYPGIAVIAANDDAEVLEAPIGPAGPQASHLEVRFIHDGLVFVRASSAQDFEFGDFDLVADRGKN